MRISDWSSDVCSSDLQAPWHKRQSEDSDHSSRPIGRRAEVCNSLAVNSFRRFGKLSDQPRSPPKAYEKHRCENCSSVMAIRPSKPATHAMTFIRSAASAMHCSHIAISLLQVRSEEHTSELQSLM